MLLSSYLRQIMKLEFYSLQKNKMSFGRALTTEEKKDFQKTVNDAKKILGADGKSILIVHDACLPQSHENNTGVGNISSKESLDFINLMKAYTGINSVEVLPPGEVKPGHKGCYCNYNSTTLSLGTHQINLELLTKPEFGEILSKEEFADVVRKNDSPTKETITNNKNVFGENSSHFEALTKAYNRFKKQLTPESAELQKRFDEYKANNTERLEPKALFKALAKEYGTDDWHRWHEIDKNLLNPETDANKAKERIQELNKKYPDEMDFYKFRQFIADEHLSLGRNKLNNMGLKFIGDVPLCISHDEVWANQKAFLKDFNLGWGIPAFDLDNLYNKDGSLGASGKFLKQKLEFFMKRYDELRLDVGWSYMTPYVYKNEDKCRSENLITLPNQSPKLINFIDKTAKDFYKENYSSDKLLFEADAERAPLFNWNIKPPRVIQAAENKVLIHCTEHMHDENYGWGSVDFYINKAQIPPENLVIGVGNHDTIPLRKLSSQQEFITRITKEGNKHIEKKEISNKWRQLNPLSKFLNIPKEKLIEPKEFAKAKFAELFTGAKSIMFFYMDVMGREERFNKHSQNGPDNFGYKIKSSFESDYHSALQEGHGLNIMDAMGKAFTAKGLHEKQPELYEKIIKFRDILYEKGALTEAEANKLFNAGIKLKSKSLVPLFGLSGAGIILAETVHKSRKKRNQASNTAAAEIKPNQNVVNFHSKIFDDFNKFSKYG